MNNNYAINVVNVNQDAYPGEYQSKGFQLTYSAGNIKARMQVLYPDSNFATNIYPDPIDAIRVFHINSSDINECINRINSSLLSAFNYDISTIHLFTRPKKEVTKNNKFQNIAKYSSAKQNCCLSSFIY